MVSDRWIRNALAEQRDNHDRYVAACGILSGTMDAAVGGTDAERVDEARRVLRILRELNDQVIRYSVRP